MRDDLNNEVAQIEVKRNRILWEAVVKRNENTVRRVMKREGTLTTFLNDTK